MTETAIETEPMGCATTPAGIQPVAVLARRRVMVSALVIATLAPLAWAVMTVLGAGGWHWIEIAVFCCFLVASPLTVLGFWNAIIGLVLILRGEAGRKLVSPFATDHRHDQPVMLQTAVLLTLRNEDAERAITRLSDLQRALDRTGCGDRFAFFVLSDTDDVEIAAREEQAFAAWTAHEPAGRFFYRRRDKNTGFKAGNVRDFLDRWGAGYDLMLPLDADSVMGADTILRLVRIMQAFPRLGILQSLVVGLPSRSAFARIFQFGMRHGMRSYTTGSAWWAGDCGPYWGHNAVVRVAPFHHACDLPLLPGTPPLGGHILSHDQVEAVLMRRAGYEVRVLPEETESWEENPPTLVDFTKRDLRWCQGNMQYWRLLGLENLKAVSRFQLVAAIQMYLGAFAWMLMVALTPLLVFVMQPGDFPIGLGIALFVAMFVMSATPKIAGILDVALSAERRAAYGGTLRFTAGAMAEFVFSILLAPVAALRVTLFMIGLVFGRSVIWSGQARDAHALSWTTAASGLWPQTLFGLAIVTLFLIAAPTTLPWALPVVTGLILAIPFAVATASPWLGAWTERMKLCAIPEELSTPAPLQGLDGHVTARAVGSAMRGAPLTGPALPEPGE
ncbi:MAG: glucans biosynthesis glucosyltransferase MdoH [Pseudomonadota bacterium]